MLGTMPSLAFTASSSSLARPWAACGLIGVMRSMVKLLQDVPGVPADEAGDDRARLRQTGLSITQEKREGLHALLFAHQFQGSVTGHVGGVRVALDHGGYDGPLHQ